jgi:hypothetical protein
MGAWGVLAFDNDDAGDWAYGLEEVDDLSLVESAFEVVEGAGDYLEAPDASNALAACEVIARLQGKPGYANAYTETVDNWVAAHPMKPSANLVARAGSMIDRILGENSELAELWRESDEGDAWVAAVEELRGRVRG